jgi:hypothetical protein
MEHQDIFDALNPLSAKEAREAINTGKIYVGDLGNPRHIYAMSLVTAKEAALRDSIETESLSISRKALSISRDAKNIAIIAMILSITISIIAIIVTLWTRQ